jgi:hypothetical protein
MSVSEKYESVKIMSQWKLWVNEYYEREGLSEWAELVPPHEFNH